MTLSPAHTSCVRKINKPMNTNDNNNNGKCGISFRVPRKEIRENGPECLRKQKACPFRPKSGTMSKKVAFLYLGLRPPGMLIPGRCKHDRYRGTCAEEKMPEGVSRPIAHPCCQFAGSRVKIVIILISSYLLF